MVMNSKARMKGGRVKSLTANPSEMGLVNEFTLEPLSEGDVYLFEVAACDNDIDRDFERFDDEALSEMAELMKGRTFIKDHRRESDNQVARIYECEVIDVEGKATSDGLPLKQLVVKCYMLDTEANKQLISEIKAGIKKEVSVSFMPNVIKCSICGQDNRKEPCNHYWGREYDGETCHFTFQEIIDAYELSFVAVPAQKNAGTKKDYAFDDEPPEDSAVDPPGEEEDEKQEEKASEEGAFFDAQTRIRMAEAELENIKLKGCD